MLRLVTFLHVASPRWRDVTSHLWAIAAGLALGASSCASERPATAPSVGGAFQRRATAPPTSEGSSPTDDSSRPLPATADAWAPVSDASPIATVDGRPIGRGRVVDLLMRAHGAGVLEQLIVLEAVEELAAQRGLIVTQAEIDREYDDALRRLVDPMAGLTAGSFDRARAAALLDTVLSSRNISHEEFQLTVRRNVFLRHVVEADLSISEEQLEAEFDRLYGERVQCRHIQLATRGEVARAQERLAAGEPFSEVAERYSANLSSAEQGGLLEPFSLQDESVPPALREEAARSTPGSGPSVLRIGEWYHIVQMERVLPAADVAFAEVRDELERRRRRHLAEPGMRDLYERLFREAKVEIHDPVLREAFDRKHPERRKQARQ